MPQTREGPSPSGRDDPGISSCLEGIDSSQTSRIERPSQAEKRNPLAVREARLWIIREELYGDLDEIRIFAERGMRALEVENDLDLGRTFDQSVKHFLAVAANLKELILVKTDAPL
jgi:hypothetical protein